MSNTDIWTKENCKMKVSGDGTVMYLSRRSSILLFKKNILSTFEKNITAKKHAENMKTFQIEKKHEKKKHETHAKLHLHAWSLLCFPSKL